MIAILSTLTFAVAGIVALSVIGYMVGPNWQRITRTVLGHPDTPPHDRWRTVHLAADQRRPFHKLRGAPNRRRASDEAIGNQAAAMAVLRAAYSEARAEVEAE